jgi:hypothetical protein
MIDDHSVKLATKYLDESFTADERPTLVGMLNYVDYFNRIVMKCNEVNQVLLERPEVYVQRIDCKIFFSQASGDREITPDDLAQAIDTWTKKFWGEYKELQNRKS